MPPMVTVVPPPVNPLCPHLGTLPDTVGGMAVDERRQFAKRLRRLRNKRGLSMQQLADASAISYSYVRSMEAGIKNPPSSDVLQRIARVLEISVDELLSDDSTAQHLADLREAKEAYEAGIAAQERIGRVELSGSIVAKSSMTANLTVTPGPKSRAYDTWAKINELAGDNPDAWEELDDILDGLVDKLERKG